MSVRILRGDVLAMLATLPDESVHCCVTSPPYYGLRDYGVAGQLGLEPTLAEYIEKMVAVFREVRRVLRSDGTLWLNIGDSYNSIGHKKSSSGYGTTGLAGGKTQEHHPLNRETGVRSLKHKDLLMVPERLALALQADGWWVRSRIIWHKRSTMPESVTDRPTKAHEHIWLLTKSERYFYDSEAASEPCEGVERDQPEFRKERSAEDQKTAPDAERNGIRPMKRSGNKQRKPASARGVPVDTNGSTNGAVAGSIPWEGSTRNWRDVWSLGPEPFKDAHFATFPTEIPRRAIVAGSPAQCCSKCGAPYERKTEVVGRRDVENYTGQATKNYASAGAQDPSETKRRVLERMSQIRESTFAPSCRCGAHPSPGTVLDPFLGSGTTALVADRLQRNAIGIELNPAYADMAEKRIRGDSPLFAEVA